jgi:hypothetical protein
VCVVFVDSVIYEHDVPMKLSAGGGCWAATPTPPATALDARTDDHTADADGKANLSQCLASATRRLACSDAIDAGSPSWSSQT